VTAMRRPRLLPGLPVLYRLPGETQVGIDPRYAAVIPDAPPELGRLLHTLDGRDTTEDLLARAGPERQPALATVLDELALMGLLEDAAVTPSGGLPGRLVADCTDWAVRMREERRLLLRRRAEATVAVYGSGRLAVAIAVLLAGSGIGWVQPSAEGVVAPEDLGSGYLDADLGTECQAAIGRAVRRAGPEARCGPLPAGRLPDLAVLTDSVVPDRGLAANLTAAGVPQLLVRASEGHGVVGPLVIPGRTCCLNCLDLHAMDADPCWLTVATQLIGRSQRADLATTHTTTGIAVGQVLRVLHGSPEAAELPCWGARIEVDSFAGRTERVPTPPHPHCGCGSAGRRDTSEAGTTAAGDREPITSGPQR
jgi:bacteriocin biosynthesis cyclodehydratase domain-containing protein